MRVLVVSEPGTDGVFRYVEALCRYLLEREVEVHLAYSDRRGSDRLQALVREVAARGGLTLNLRVGNRPGWGDWRGFRRLLRGARRVRPDIVHSHSSKAGALARALALCGIRARQIYHPHAYAGLKPERRAIDRVYDRVEQALGRTSWTVACSPFERAFALDRLRLPPGRVRCIPNGVDVRTFTPPTPERRLEARGQFGLPAEAVVLGCLARAAPQKDPITLYRAFAAAGRPAVLWHVGEGELDGALRAEAARLGLDGRLVRRPAVVDPAAFHRAIDGFVLTSRYEGCSLAALEAMASGAPLILSRAAGNLDLLALPLSHAWSAPPGDAPGFAAAISAWFDDVSRARPSNHAEIARARFDAGRQLAAVLELYRELAPEDGPPAAPGTDGGRARRLTYK